MQQSPPDVIEFPIRLASEIEDFSVADDMQLKRMDAAARNRLFQIKDAEFDESGHLKSCTSLSEETSLWMFGPNLDNFDQFYSSNYLLVAPNRDRALDFNFAIKLTGSSCSSIYMGYQSPGKIHLVAPPCYFGTTPLKFTHTDVLPFQRLVALASNRNNHPKLATMSDIYLNAMSRAPRKESRFIDIAVILEMLLLPEHSSELAYRFRLRMARMLSILFDYDASSAFALGKRIYETRSKLVHKGQDNELDRIAPETYEVARMLLAKYTEQPQLFNEDALELLCLQGSCS